MLEKFLLVLLAVFLLHGLRLLSRRLEDEERSPRLERAARIPRDRKAWPRVSIVVPARNEETHLETCLSFLTRLDYEPLEILVVDDRSTDRTAEIAGRHAGKDPRLRVIPGEETPAGWTGKNYAIHQGACRAGGDYLLIVDADTVLKRDTLKRSISYMEEEKVDLLTLYPRAVCASFWEKTLMPWLGVLSVFRMDRVNDPGRKEAMAFGYFLLFRRASFDRLGGYESIRGRVGEDWVIARRVKQAGLRLRMLLGAKNVTKRFGPSFAEIWQGFTKNFILIMEGRRAVALLAAPLMLYYLLFTVLPWVLLLASPAAMLAVGDKAAWLAILLLAALQIAVMGAVRSLLRCFLHVEVSAPYLQPLGGLVIAAMGFTGIFRTLRGKGIRWRGREYRKF